MNSRPANADPTKTETLPKVTEINYPDGTVNRSYSGEGTVDLESESLTHSGMAAEAPYMLVDASGGRHFVSPALEGVGVMLTPAPNEENPDRKRFILLKLHAPKTVTLGERFVVPGVPEERQIREPIVRIDMLGMKRQDSYALSSGQDDVVIRKVDAKVENPFVKIAPHFDKAIERARALGRLTG